jgi:hypothetical protein
MIAINNSGGGDKDRPNDVQPAVNPEISNGGYIGGLPSLTDLRVRSNANRLTKMVEAGEIAAEALATIVKKAKKRMTETCTDRDFAALSKLVVAIAQAPDKQGDTHNHLHMHQGDSIQIVHVDDWYGSKAANLAAPDGSSTPDSPCG